MNDITIDEQATAIITVYPTYADGSPVNLTSVGPGTTGSIRWAAYNPQNQDSAKASQYGGIEKDTQMMTIMIGPQLSTTTSARAAAGQQDVHFTKVSTFGADSWGRIITDLVVGDILTFTNEEGAEEYCTVASINPDTKVVSMVNNLIYAHETGNTISRIVPWFTFTILEGDTILPATKVYGTPTVWEHMAIAKFPEGLNPQNIYQEPRTLVVLRGRLFIDPSLNMD